MLQSVLEIVYTPRPITGLMTGPGTMIDLRKHIMFKRTLLISLMGSTLALSGMASAEDDRSAVLERIKPIGTVTVAGQAPATPVPADAEPAEAAAPAMEAAPAVEAAAESVAEAAAPAAAAAVDGQAIYMTACFACHGTGAAGAPKLGDQAAWGPRVATGRDALMASAMNGKGAMPPKGGQMHLGEAEISAAIDYMLDSVK